MSIRSFLTSLICILPLLASAQNDGQVIESGPPIKGANNPVYTPIEIPPVQANDRFIQYREINGLKGFQNTQTGQWVIEPIYEQIEAPYGKTWFVAMLGGKQGLLDQKGKTLLPFEFEQIQNPPTATIGRRDTVLFRHFIVKKNGLYGLYDLAGREIEPVTWSAGTWVNGKYALFSKKGTQRLLDHHCKVVFEHHFEEIAWVLDESDFQKQRYFTAQDSNGKKGLLDLRGNVVLPFEYLGFEWSSGNFVCAQKERYGLFEVVNLQGRQVLPSRFGMIQPMMHGLFVARDFKTKKVGVLDSTARVLVPFEYNLCYVVGGASGFIGARKEDELTAVFDTSGNQLSERIYTENLNWSKTAPFFLSVQLPNEKWRLIDGKGFTIIEDCDEIKFSFSSIIAGKDGWNAFYLNDGSPVTGYKYKNARGFLSQKQALQLAKDVRLPAHLTLLGSAFGADKVQYWIADDGQQFRIPGN